MRRALESFPQPVRPSLQFSLTFSVSQEKNVFEMANFDGMNNAMLQRQIAET